MVHRTIPPPSATKILVVDDDADQVERLSALLRRAGYDAHTAGSASQAQKLARAIAPSLAILDVGLPDLDGFELTKRLKKDAGGFLPVVLLTGYGDPDSKRRGVEAGADEFLQKPVSPFELDLRLRSLLRIKALTDELARQNHRLLELANTDPLTGVPNRRHVLEQLRREARRAGRYGNPLCALLLDLDHFKQVNDHLGHAIGDEVLVAAARALASGIREEDTLGRIGGEEFLVVAPHIALPEAVRMAERMRVLVTTRPALGPHGPVRITVSIGVAGVSAGGGQASAHALVEAADRALYAAKEGGRDRVVWLDVDGDRQTKPIRNRRVR